MIDEEINQILNSDKAFQWKVIQLQNIGKKIYDQFNQEEFKSQLFKLTPKLKSEIDDIRQHISAIDIKLKENEAIFKQKEEIETKHIQLSALEKELEELHRKNDALKNITKVQVEVKIATNEKDTLIKKQIETLTTLNQVLIDVNTILDKQLASKTKDAIDNLNLILIHLDTSHFKTYFPLLSKTVADLVIDYNDHVEKIKMVRADLEEISLKHDEVISIFNTHHLENEMIFGALRTREGVLQYIQNISNEISERLKQYDSEIKSLVEKRDQLPIYQLVELRKYN